MVIAAITTSAIGVHMVVAFATMYLLTGSVALGGIAARVEPVCTVTVMPLHEVLWRRIPHQARKRRRETVRREHEAVEQRMPIA